MTKYRYLGDGEFLAGVPARDLDTEEDELDKSQLEAVRASAKSDAPLYALVAEKAAEKPAEKSDKPAAAREG